MGDHIAEPDMQSVALGTMQGGCVASLAKYYDDSRICLFTLVHGAWICRSRARPQYIDTVTSIYIAYSADKCHVRTYP